MTTDIDAVLQEHCLADLALRQLVGNRIYPDAAPAQTADPYIVRTLIQNQEHDDLEGPVPVGSPSYQFAIFASTPALRDRVAKALRGCLLRYSGGMGDVEVHDVMGLDESDDIETPLDGSERRIRARRIDVQVWHAREITR